LLRVPRCDLNWRKRNGSLSLHLGRQVSSLLRVVPDTKWPAMWRIEFPDGKLSDLGNLTRIKDAAAGIAVAMLDQQKEVQEQPQDGSPMRSAANLDAGQPSVSSEAA
jgi:hypothetical protein